MKIIFSIIMVMLLVAFSSEQTNPKLVKVNDNFIIELTISKYTYRFGEMPELTIVLKNLSNDIIYLDPRLIEGFNVKFDFMQNGKKVNPLFAVNSGEMESKYFSALYPRHFYGTKILLNGKIYKLTSKGRYDLYVHINLWYYINNPNDVRSYYQKEFIGTIYFE